MSSCCSLDFMISDERLADSLIEAPLYLTEDFFVSPFKVLSLIWLSKFDIDMSLCASFYIYNPWNSLFVERVDFRLIKFDKLLPVSLLFFGILIMYMLVNSVVSHLFPSLCFSSSFLCS